MVASRGAKRLKRLLGCLVAVLVLAGVLTGAAGFVIGHVPQYRGALQQWLSERSGLAIEFSAISARLRLYGPELVFSNALVRTADHERILVQAARGSVGLDLWNALRTGRLSAGRFTLEGPHIELVRTSAGRLELLGQGSLPQRRDLRAFTLEQLPTGRFNVRQAVVKFHDEITGRGPWLLSGVNFVLSRDPHSMHLRGDASLPRSLGGGLSFSAASEGALEDYASMVSTFTIEGSRIDLAGWRQVMPDTWPDLAGGHGSLQVSGVLQGTALLRLSAKVALADVSATMPQWTIALPGAAPMRQPAGSGAAPILAPADPPVDVASSSTALQLDYEHIGFALQLQRENTAWTAVLRDVELSGAHSRWHAQHIQARWAHDEGGVLGFTGRADSLALQSLWPLLAWLPERPLLAWLRALDMRGEVRDLQFTYSKAPAESAHYTLHARLQQVGFAPIGQAPGLRGLSAELQASEQGGRARLAAQDLQFELPRLYREPLQLQSLSGSLHWRREGRGWLLAAEDLRAQNDDGRAQGQIELTLPGDGRSPLLQLEARLQDLQVGATSRYVPAGMLSVHAMEWFDQAFVAGTVNSARVSLHGPVRSFPFRDGTGSFQAQGHVENAIFNYQPGWTPARDIMADVEFHNASLAVRAASASVDELRLGAVRAQIDDLQKLHVVVETAVRGQLQQGLRFLKHSPIAANLGADFARLSGNGPIEGNVRLDLPIKSFDDRMIEVTTRLRGARVSMQGVAASIDALTGFLTLRNTQLAAAELHGRWLGGDFKAQAQVGAGQDPDTSMLRVRGHATAAHLQTLLGLPPAVRLEGATDWAATATFRPASAAVARSWTLDVDSDLAGLVVELPEPAGKSAAQSRAFQLAVQLSAEDTLLARGAFGDVRALLRLTRANGSPARQDGWRLDRGGVRADGIPPALPDHRGLRLEGSLHRLSLDQWLALSSNDGVAALSDFLRAANLRIGELQLFGYTWKDVRGLLQATSSGWRVDVAGPDGTGQVLIPMHFSEQQPLRANLEHLVLRRSETVDAASTSRNGDPRTFPNLQLHVGDLRWGERTIGAVDLAASKLAQGIRFDSIDIQGPGARATGHGEWLASGQEQHCSLMLSVTSADVEATLSALGYGQFIEARHGQVDAEVSWPGGFDGNIMARASGSISVRVETGQLMSVQPGAGRVLGLLSIAALPRRLALDFSDLTDKGLAFDSVHGDFQLHEGNAYTSNLVLSGPAAQIGIAGRTGLGTRDYDQTAVITGSLGASLPMAGVLAGGPAIGAALLVFSQVFKEPLKGITRGYYRITGPWEEPVIERVEAGEVDRQAVGRAGESSPRAAGALQARSR